MATIARQLAEYGLRLSFKDLPREVVDLAKKAVLDTLGCAVGGYPSQAGTIVRAVLPELGGVPESTVLGDGTKTSCMNAALANGVMVRFLDYNDYYTLPPPVHSGSHPSEVIPPILAVGEREHSSGERVIEAIVAGYELNARFVHGCTVRLSLERRGWNSDLRAGLIVPVVIGKLLGLNEEQVENAIGSATSLNMVLGILDASKEEYTMAKNLRFPLSAYDAILATLLARKGFTGPRRVVEGSRGFVESVMQGEFDLAKFTDFRGFKIMETGFKLFAADATTHGHLTATLELVKEHDIKPEHVARIRVWSTSRNVEHTGQAEKRYPKNKETADHSSYYLTAVAIMDRQIGPGQYTLEKYESPVVRELNDKIVSFEVGPGLDQYPTAGASEITTNQGQVYRKEVHYPKGAYQNPATPQDIEDKFRSMALARMPEGQVKKIVGTINRLENLKDIGELMRLFRFHRGG